jgi:putative ATPase
VDSALQVGFPEARLHLAEATIFLARQPKSNSVISAIDLALRDAETVNNCEIPDHLKDGHYAGAKNLNKSQEYKYPHDYKDHWVKQTYLPKPVSDRKYYIPGDNKTEKAYEEAWKKIKK